MQPQIGLANLLLSYVGIKGPNWLGSVEWALPSLVIVSLWGTVGGSRMIIFLAGLQSVPKELYEAAQIDGAGRMQQFRHVTLPMMSPVIFFNLVLGIIAALRAFDLAYVATNGGPAYATWFYSIHIYQNAFVSFDMGYASSLAWIFFVVMLAFTWVQFRASASWVYYAGEERN
jgi:multiple sugar transport system permease protein